MTKDEAPTSPKDAALTLALEALEQIDPYVDQLIDYSSTAAEYPLNNAPRNVVKAITAIKEALAQPWKGLTKEEINSALSKYQNWYDFAAHLENILKEKNQ